MNDIAANLARLRARIDATAAAAGRASQSIRLIAVSKGHSVDAIRIAARTGQRAFGENTMQEALRKIPHLTDVGIDWHFIGHLQSNKAKFLPGNFAWLHSLDSSTLAERVSRLAIEKNIVVDTLIEVNITGDKTKHGVAPSELDVLLDRLLRKELPGMRLRGLMTIAPYPANENEIRAAFARLRELRDQGAERFALAGFTELSMGMSGDYVEAIKEGATMIRVGTAIFGERHDGTR